MHPCKIWRLCILSPAKNFGRPNRLVILSVSYVIGAFKVMPSQLDLFSSFGSSACICRVVWRSILPSLLGSCKSLTSSVAFSKETYLEASLPLSCDEGCRTGLSLPSHVVVLGMLEA